MIRTVPVLAIALIFLLLGTQALAEDGLQHASLSIPNMVCMSCEMRVEQAMTSVSGVSHVSFDQEAKIAVVSFDPDQASLDAILAACEEAGYPATIVDRSET